MKIQKIIFLFIIAFTSKPIIGQISDSLKKVIWDRVTSREEFKETIYDLKGKELPKFELKLLNGEILNSESLKGKPTLINLWFSNCQPCIDEMPLFNTIKSTLGNDVNFIALTFQDEIEVRDFLKTNIFDFVHVIDSQEYIDKMGIKGYPKTLILDKNLTVIEIEKGIPKDYANEKRNRAEFVSRLSNLLIELKSR